MTVHRRGGAMLVVLAAACGRLVGTDDQPVVAVVADASPAADAAPTEGGSILDADATVPDAGPCLPNELRCRGTCVTSCSQCADPIECFACDSTQKNPIGTCEPAATAYCLAGDYSKAYKGGPGEHCDCSNTDVTHCPGTNQVCEPNGGTDWCITCGESNVPSATGGRACRNGLTCNTTVSPPRCQ